MKETAVGIVLGMIFLGILIAYHIIEVDNAFERGKAECISDSDTIFVHGQPQIEYKDTVIFITRTDTVIEKGDTLFSSFDSSFVSNKDTITLHHEMFYITGVESLLNQYKIFHKDAEIIQKDTAYIYQPKYMTEIKTETNWLLVLISYVGGILTAILSILLIN